MKTSKRILIALASGDARATAVQLVNAMIAEALLGDHHELALHVYKGEEPACFAGLALADRKCWQFGRRGLKSGKWYSSLAQMPVRRSLTRWVTGWKPDVVFLDGTAVLFLWLPLIERLPSCRFYCILHNTVTLARYGKRIERALRLPNVAFVGVSHTTVASFVDQGIPADRMHAIPNAFDFAGAREGLLSKEDAKRQLGLEAFQSPVFGVLGRLEQVKQPGLILAAFRSYVKQGGAGSLVFFGDGSLAADLSAQAEAWGVGERVRITGWLKGGGRYLGAADVYVGAALKEGLSIALFEALAARLPIICSDIPAFREVAPNGAVFFAPCSEAELSTAMLAKKGAGSEAMDYRREEAIYGVARLADAYRQLVQCAG